MQGSAAETPSVDELSRMFPDDDNLITLRVIPRTPRHFLTITAEGKVEPGPGLEMDEVAQRFLESCSNAHIRLSHRSERMERVLRECRLMLRGLGLRAQAHAFWKEMDALLGEDPEGTTLEEILMPQRE